MVPQEQTRRTEKRRNPETGATYPWIVKSTAMVNHFYFYCLDDDFGIGKRLQNLPALREVGLPANRR